MSKYSTLALALFLSTGCALDANDANDVNGNEADLGSTTQQIAVAGSRIMRNQWVCNAGEMLLGLDTSVAGGRIVCQALSPTTWAAGSSNSFTARNLNGEAVCGGESGGGGDQIAVGWKPTAPVGIYCRTLANFTSGYNNKYAKHTLTSADLATPSHTSETFISGGNEVRICQGVGYAVRGYTVKNINFGPGQNWLTGFYNCSH